MTKVQKSTVSYTSNNGGFGSVVHNKETLRHFCSSNVGTKEAKKSFLARQYRWRNLTLADGLDSSKFSQNKVVNKAVRALRFCCGGSIVGADENGGGSIAATSQSCKNQNCCICARRKSAKYGARLFAAMADPENKKHFDGKYWYMLTLTMKHDDNSGVYLDRLSECSGKLFRSKFWKELTNGGGWLSHVESVFGNSGAHIHCHILLCIDPLKRRIKDVQSDISAKWEKVTGDSFVVSLDIPKSLKGAKTVSCDALRGAVMELFKYSTKTDALKKMTGGDFDRYAEFVIWTKGKKFIRCGGFLKGMQITSLKSKYDDEPGENDFMVYRDLYAVRTGKIRFSENPDRDYSRKRRREIIDKVFMVSISDFEEIVPEVVPYYLDNSHFKVPLSEWIISHASSAVVPPPLEETMIEYQEKVKQLEMWKRADSPTFSARAFVDS